MNTPAWMQSTFPMDMSVSFWIGWNVTASPRTQSS
jgi:hypothetical protein